MRKGFNKNRLAVAIGACIALSGNVVQALGVGEIEVETALNEPLVAKIMLTSASAEELNTLSVGIAPREAFSRMGIERHPILRELSFELIVDGSNTPYVAVSSTKSVREPFLDFILKLDWANGQMLREYTLLLDPPIFDRSEKAGEISAATTASTSVVRDQTVVASKAAGSHGSYGPTSRVDTLWTIGSKMRPSRDVTVPQMMIALLKKNPEAFDRGNINNLKAGYILRAPEMEMITALTRSQAANESSRQYQSWLADRGKGPRPAARTQQRVMPEPANITAAPSTAASVPAVQEQQKPEARLQLLTADEEARIRSGVGSGATDGGASNNALKQELAIAVEAGETIRQENNELRGRLAELESQLQSVQKLLTLKDDTLGSLQADQQKTVEVSDVVAETKAVVQPKLEPKAVTPPPQVAEASIVDDLLNDPNMPIMAGGGLLALVLGGWMFVRRRRQSEDDDMFPTVAEISPATDKTASAAMTGAATEVVEEAVSEVVSDDVSLGDFGGMGAIHAEESEIDPIAEADVYLAYRRYEQAEALMKEAIASDPGRAELKLKLLEIYFTTKDKDSFEAQAEALYAGLAGQDDSLWQQAAEMGRELAPEHPLFSEGLMGESVDEVSDVEVLAEQDSSLDDVSLVAEDAVLSDDDLASSLMSDEFNIDTELTDAGADTLDDLDLDLDDGLEIGSDELGLSDADEIASLDDFDLGDDGLESIGASEKLDESLTSNNLGDDLDSLSDSVDAGISSLDEDLGKIDLGDELDLGSKDIQELAEQDAFGSALDDAFNLDDVLPEDSEATESLDKLTAELDDVSTDDVADSFDEFDLSESLDDSDDLLAGIDDLDVLSELDDKPNKQEATTKPFLSLLDKETKPDEDDEFVNPDLDSFTSEKSASWGVEAAQSIFESRDIFSEENNIQAASSSSVKPVAVANVDEESLIDISDLADIDFSEMSEEDDSDIFDSSEDMVGTKLDLAKAYIEMGDQDGANSILDEVSEEGNDNQRQEAEGLKQQIS